MGKPNDELKNIQLYPSPWVAGTRVTSYLGPVVRQCYVSEKRFKKDMSNAWERAINLVLLKMKKAAFDLDANAIVGMELSCNPFFEKLNQKGLLVIANGTIAKLEKLY